MHFANFEIRSKKNVSSILVYTENLKYRVWELRQYLADALKSHAIGKSVCGVFRGRMHSTFVFKIVSQIMCMR